MNVTKLHSEPYLPTATAAELMQVCWSDSYISRNFYGTVRATASAELAFSVSGMVTFVHPKLREGAEFAKGDVLVEIDPTPYALALRTAEADLRRAEAELREMETERDGHRLTIDLQQQLVELASREKARTEKLAQGGYAALATRDERDRVLLATKTSLFEAQRKHALTEARMETKRADIDRLSVAVEQAHFDLSQTKIVAPFDAIVSHAPVVAGEFASPVEAVVSVYDPRQMEVAFTVPNIDLPGFVRASKADTDMRLTIQHRRGAETVSFQTDTMLAAGAANPHHGGTDFIATIAAADEHVRPGVFVTVSAIQKRGRQALKVPASALHEGAVLVVDSAAMVAGQVVEFRVETANILDVLHDGFLIDAAAEPDEAIVTTPVPNFRNMRRIKVSATHQHHADCKTLAPGFAGQT